MIRALSLTRRLCQPSHSYTTSSVRLAKILASDPIEKVCADIFKQNGHELVEKPGIKKEELIKIIGDYDGLVVRSATKVTKEIVEAGVNLKVIGRAGTGVDNIDIRAATSRGILVVNTPGANTISTGELALSHILSLARNIPQATASLKAGKWERSKYTGTELSGKVLGVIGVGRIGREVAGWCRGFGMSTIGYDPLLSEHSARVFGVDPVTLDELFAQADFITIHTPLTKETANIINEESLRKCKKGVRIINCARGGIIDEAALLGAIKTGQVAGAALDVFEVEPPDASSKELRLHHNVVVTPHLGASTFDAQERVAKAVAENMSGIFDGSEYVGVVNAPDLGSIAKKPHLIPYISLAEKIGSMQAQLLRNNKISCITINLRGKDIADAKTADVIKSAVLKGALSELVEQTVTYVNAASIAEELGLRVLMNLSEKTEEVSGLVNSLSVELEIEGLLNMTRIIEGAVFGKHEIRITNIDGFVVELPPGEHMLMFNNYDRPGILKKVAEKLAAANINISHLTLGRKGKGVALGAIVIDTPMTQEQLEAVAEYADLSNVSQIRLSNSLDPVFRIGGSSMVPQGEVVGSKKPFEKPVNPEFSSGPCKKHPGFDLTKLRTDVLGRSHRSKLGKSRLKKVIEDTKRVLNIPKDYVCGIVPASDTGAFEMAMWSMLGEKPVDVCYWESFGKGWKDDISKHLALPNVREFSAPYGELPDLRQTNPDHDILFTFNGTTSGVRVRDLDWISADRTGLTFNDATSAAFAMDIDWTKTDVSTFSWQKALGGEGAHGMLVLSPRAVQRLETFKPKRPLPKVFRLTKKNESGATVLESGVFQGDTINTPSMLCVEDFLSALSWADRVGGLAGLKQRTTDNLRVLEAFAAKHAWIDFLAKDETIRSSTSVCLTLKLSKSQIKHFVALLEQEEVAFDIGSYRDAPDGLRIWCGATVEKEDLELLMPWLEWAYEVSSQVK